MEVFELPLDACTHLTHRIKKICRDRGYEYRNYKAQVYRLLATDLGKVWARRRSIYRVLRDYGVADQRSDSWHLRRSEMMTASEITKAFKTASPSAKKELLMRKLDGPKAAGDSGPITACLWGTQFEPLAKEIYGDIQGGAEIVDTTCVVHPIYPFLGASPDGIVLTKDKMDYRWGKLVEFKCPISRKFTQESAIPDAYYHQMQMQMECCNIDECDYVEMQFKTCGRTEWNASDSPYKGVMVVYDDGKISYKSKEEDPDVWKSKIEGDEHRVVWWYLANIRIDNVLRDPRWLTDRIDEFKEFWSMVLDCRRDPSRMEHYIPPTAPPAPPDDRPSVAGGNREPADSLLSGRTMIIHLGLESSETCDQETPGLQSSLETQQTGLPPQ
jgi:putative phage-type endonuclease